MNFDKDIYKKYYKIGQNKAYLYEALRPYDPQFSLLLLNDINECRQIKDGELLELQMIPLFVFLSDVNIHSFVDIFNLLIIEDWHCQHENIVYFLEMIADSRSVPYLFDAVFKNFPYLNWDSNKSFERKCIWALYKIHTDDAKDKLEYLSTLENDLIADFALHQLEKF